MIRPLTCICLLFAGGSGLYLYQSKHQAQMLDREIEHTLKEADAARDRINVLRGEWALLNEPERLAALSQAHLGLKSLAPSQFVTVAELGARLPPPAALGTTYDAGEEVAPIADALPPPPAPAAPPMPAHAATAVAKATPPSPAAVSRSVAARSVLAPVMSISANSIVAPAAVASTVIPGPRLPSPHPAASVVADNHAGAAPTRPATASSQGVSIGESVARMAHLQGGTQAASLAAQASPPAYSPPASQPAMSALGGTRPVLPPPVPYGSSPASLASSR